MPPVVTAAEATGGFSVNGLCREVMPRYNWYWYWAPHQNKHPVGIYKAGDVNETRIWTVKKNIFLRPEFQSQNLSG
jgi:hypothetical protein